MDDEPADEWAYAPIDTIEGLLQRGRGLGALRARRDPAAAAELVYDAVRKDWRWDSVDDRHVYLARLIQELGLPLLPVVAMLDGDEDDCERATRVLELLAKAGSLQARQALRAHVREGEHWVDVLESVADAWPVEWWDDLAEVARARLTGNEQLLWRSEPWVRWRIGAEPAERPWRRASEAGEEPSNRHLLAVLADPAQDDSAKSSAIHMLAGRPPEPGLLLLVPSLGSANGEWPLPHLPRAVRALGALAVPAARAWAADSRSWLSWLGMEVLAGHGETRDLPVLVAGLTAQWRERCWCGPSTLADGLARYGREAAEAAPVLRRFWLYTPHSYERPAYLRALAAIDPAGLDLAYTESLWDCEAPARLLGIASAPEQPHVARQFGRLRDDPMEEPEVRAAAGTRLADNGAAGQGQDT